MTTLPLLTGPSRSPASGGPARQLVVLLHGVGADGSHLIEMAPLLSTKLPDAVFIAPDAPFPCDMWPEGRQWFSLQDRTPGALAAGVRAATPILDQFLDQKLAELGLTDDQLVLIGFSQGAMLSLFDAPRRPKAMGAVVGIAGALVSDDTLGAEVKSTTPVLLIHGDEDRAVDPGCMYHATSVLTQHGFAVTASMYSGLGHVIDERVQEAVAAFLNDIFNKSS